MQSKISNEKKKKIPYENTVTLACQFASLMASAGLRNYILPFKATYFQNFTCKISNLLNIFMFSQKRKKQITPVRSSEPNLLTNTNLTEDKEEHLQLL